MRLARMSTQDDHGKIHDRTKKKLQARLDDGLPIDYDFVKNAACKAHVEAVKGPDNTAVCKAKCLAVQLDAYFEQRSKGNDTSEIKASPAGWIDWEEIRQSRVATRIKVQPYEAASFSKAMSSLGAPSGEEASSRSSGPNGRTRTRWKRARQKSSLSTRKAARKAMGIQSHRRDHWHTRAALPSFQMNGGSSSWTMARST